MIVSQVIERQWCPFTTVSLKYENLKLQIVRKKPSLLSLSQIKTPYYAFQLQLRHRKTNERKSSKKKHFYHFTLKCPCSVNKVKYRRSACVLSSSIFPQFRPWALFRVIYVTVGFDREISDNVSFIKTVSSGISISMSVTCVNMSPLIDSIPFCFYEEIKWMINA